MLSAYDRTTTWSTMPPPLISATAQAPTARRWRMTQHALDRMTERGVPRYEVVDVLEAPDVTYGNADLPEVRVAIGGRLHIPYNAETNDVITVALRTDQDKEYNVSGWINLDAKAAEKLLASWGFTVHSEKGQVNLWTHPDDEEKRLIPFSSSERSTRANGKGSYKTAAQVVGVHVNAFVKGPTPEWHAAAAKARDLRALREAEALLDAPDPLGINEQVARQTANRVAVDGLARTVAEKKAEQEAEAPKGKAKFSEKHVRQALEAITGEPLTTQEVATLLAIHRTSASSALNELARREQAVRRSAKPNEVTTPGNPGVMWLAGPPGTEIPLRVPQTPEIVESATAQPDPEPFVMPDIAQPEEAPMPDAEIIDLTTPPAPTQKLFTATGTPWPTGGVLIQDEDGVYYVARKLVEEGR